MVSRRLIIQLQFEELISSTIEETKEIPEIISETGKIGMPHKGTRIGRIQISVNCVLSEIMRKIGELFLLRTNINSVGSVLDSPVRLDTPSSSSIHSRTDHVYRRSSGSAR